jgi:hypothetical protein
LIDEHSKSKHACKKVYLIISTLIVSTGFVEMTFVFLDRFRNSQRIRLRSSGEERRKDSEAEGERRFFTFFAIVAGKFEFT